MRSLLEVERVLAPAECRGTLDGVYWMPDAGGRSIDRHTLRQARRRAVWKNYWP